jgi:hypothetical protein
VRSSCPWSIRPNGRQDREVKPEPQPYSFPLEQSYSASRVLGHGLGIPLKGTPVLLKGAKPMRYRYRILSLYRPLGDKDRTCPQKSP